MDLKLPKKFEMKYRDYPFFYDENWISNGEFMIKKEAVKESFRYCLPDQRAQVKCDRIVPKESDYEWVKTRLIYDNGKLGYLRVFRCYELKRDIYFKEDYVKHFSIDSVKGFYEGDNLGPFISSNGMVILMPCRNNVVDFTN